MTYQNLLRTLLLAGSALGAMPPTAAFAQSVDYTAMEQMFGEPITTSVTGKPQRASEVPGDLTIITQDQIRRSGATTIPDILQFVPGIDVRHYGIGQVEVSIRGYSTPLNPRLLVLVDGRQIYADDYGRVAWNNLPVQLLEIRQIEVVKGPNSALFGFNAASGVINIITFDPLLDKVNAAQIQGGTQSFGELSAVGTGHIGDKAGLRISAGGLTEREFAKETATDGIPHPTYGSVNIDGHWQVSPNILLRASGGQSDAHTPTDVVGTTIINYAERTSYLRFGGAAETRVGTIDFDIYRNMAFDKNGTNPSYLNDTLVTKLSDLLKLNAANTVRIGLEYRSNRASGSSFAGAINYGVYSANGLWDWQITPSVDLVNAVRLDHLVLGYSGTLLPIPGRTLAAYNNATITQPSFNSGLVIKASDLDTVRLTAARGLQVPSLIDFALQTAVGPSTYGLGSPTVVPTSVWNAELAYDRGLQLLDATLTTAVFFQRNTNLLATGGNTPFVPLAPQVIASSPANVGSSDEVGVELGLSGKTAGGFRWNASYTFASITDDVSGAYSPSPTTRYDNGIPQHAVVLGAGYANGPYELDAQGKWQSRFTDYKLGAQGYQPVYMSDYVSFNARAAYKITENLTAALVGQQYDISAIFKPTGSLVERRLIASLTARF
jgi:outer membrane receptor for ferrienterochelin and colicins